MAIRFFDMFAGIGGFRSGLEAIGGFECIGHCEIDKHANMAYCAFYDTEGEYYCDDARKSGLDLKTQEELCSLKLPDSLQPNGLHFFFWKTSQGCYRMTGARRLKPSTPRLLKWGIILNGVCITADISESPSSDGACILSDILIPDVPDKYFLSAAAMRRISGNLSAAPRGKGFTIPTE